MSGNVTLAKETGAHIVLGPNADPTSDALIAEDCQEFKLGSLTIVLMHTLGHAMESTAYLLRDKKGKDQAIFSVNTLFLGDFGRSS